MYTDLKTVFDLLKPYNPVYHKIIDKKTMISSVRLMPKNQRQLMPETLYVGKMSGFDVSADRPAQMNLLMIMDIPEILDTMQSLDSSNIILIDAGCDLIEVFSLVQEVIFQAQKLIERTEEKLLQAVAEDLGLQRIIDIAYESLGNPVSVADEGLKTLGFQQGNALCDDPIWLEMLDGYISYETMTNYVIPSRNHNEYSKITRPYILEEKTPFNRKIIGRAVIHGHEVASVAVWEYEKSFRSYDTFLAECLINAVSAELQKSKYKHDIEEHMYVNFLQDILEGRLKEQKMVENRLKFLGLKFKKHFCILILAAKGLENYSLNNLRVSLEAMLVFSKAIVYKDKIVVILSFSKKIPAINVLTDSLLKTLNRGNIYIGVSRSFDNISDIKEYYEQAITASELGLYMNSEDSVIFYEDQIVYHIAELCARNVNLRQLCHPGIFELMKFDESHHTNYSKSLYAYYLHDMDIGKSAEYLKIHRNTLKYRLDKLQEILNIDLNNSRILFHIYFSFEILKYNNNLNFPVI